MIPEKLGAPQSPHDAPPRKRSPTRASTPPPRQDDDAFVRLFGIPDLPLARKFLHQQLQSRGFRSEVLDAVMAVPRHVFTPRHSAPLAYIDLALQVEGTFLQAPSVVARVVSTLIGTRVLEIGTGTGFQAAVLAQYGAKVLTLDTQPERLERAHRRFTALRLPVDARQHNDPIAAADGLYDLIVVNEALQRMPQRLLALLEPKGSIVTPTAAADGSQRLMRYRQMNGVTTAVDLGPCCAPQQPTRVVW